MPLETYRRVEPQMVVEREALRQRNSEELIFSGKAPTHHSEADNLMGTLLVGEVETPRLRLRPFVRADFEAFARMCADAEVVRFLGDGLPVGRTRAWFEMAAHVGHWHLMGYGEWAAEEKATGTFVGRIGLQRPEGWPDTEVGWILAREHWGNAIEGGRAALDVAFNRLRLPRVISMIHPDNAASIAVAQRLGETFDRRMIVNNRVRLIYAIEAQSWQSPRW
jgi:RimJ/RimL family protein N-acetyltransferase